MLGCVIFILGMYKMWKCICESYAVTCLYKALYVTMVCTYVCMDVKHVSYVFVIVGSVCMCSRTNVWTCNRTDNVQDSIM